MIRPLTIVAGKGGVGRSTVAAAIALNAATSGSRVLAVDAVNDGGLGAALASAGADVGRHQAIELLELTTEEALDEYIKIYLKVPIPPSRVRPIAKIFDYVATAAPGVREMLAIGKIAWEVREGPWDLVVVDAPATGHVIELLGAPETLGDLISVGPLADQSQWIADLLADEDITGVVAVSTAESLPVSECLELIERLGTETRVAVSGLVVTRVPDLLDQDGFDEAVELERQGTTLGAAAALVARRASSAVEEIDRLNELDLPLTWAEESAHPVAAAQQALVDIDA